MVDIERRAGYGQLAVDLNQVFEQRIEEAGSAGILSERGGKTVELWEEEDGSRFVTRSFKPSAVSYVEQGSRAGMGVQFSEAWDSMNEIFSDDNMGVVPNVLLESEGRHPFIAVSEYVDDGFPVAEAPTEFKADLAASLGGLIDLKDHFPRGEMLQEDMFVVREEASGLKAVLIDIDPLVDLKNSFYNTNINADYLERIGELLWERWCHEHEYQDVFGRLIERIGGTATKAIEESDPTHRMLEVFSNLVTMKNGINTQAAA